MKEVIYKGVTSYYSRWRLSMATYTTASLVRKSVKNISLTLLDADIEAYIAEAEGILDALMGQSFIDTFLVSKHGILRAAATKWASISAVMYDPSGFTSSTEASMIADVMWEEWTYLTGLLALDTVVRGLE